ncbi:MAG: GlxA family transcriptional regulator [Pseudomonadota bacterium]
MTASESIRVGFLVFPGFPMSCLTSMIEPFRVANEVSGQKVFAWTLISESGGRVTSSADVAFEPDLTLAEVEKLDQLFVLSGPASNFDDLRAGEGKLRRLARFGVTMGAISGGIFPLARAGLLEDAEISVHWCYAAAFQAEFPDLTATESVIALAGKRITASGAAAAFDLALHIIQDAVGAHVATEVACWFQHPMVRGQGVLQRKPTPSATCTDDMLPEILRVATEIFETHVEDPVRISDVAKATGVSSRQLERLFRQSTGMSPLQYYRSIRMKAARQLVLYSNDRLLDIAVAVGYNSSGALVHNYQEVFDVHPLEDRRKINLFRVEKNAVLPQA